MVAWHLLASMPQACFLLRYEVTRPTISALFTSLAPVVSCVMLGYVNRARGPSAAAPLPVKIATFHPSFGSIFNFFFAVL